MRREFEAKRMTRTILELFRISIAELCTFPMTSIVTIGISGEPALITFKSIDPC